MLPGSDNVTCLNQKPLKWPSLLFFPVFLGAKSIFHLSFNSSLLLAFIVYFCSGGWFLCRAIVLTGPRDLKSLCTLIKLKLWLYRIRKSGFSLYDVYRQNIKSLPADTPGILFEDQKWTAQQLLDFAERAASVYQQLGVKEGDRLALLMESHPVYAPLWLGAIRLGAATGLINFAQRHKSLQHSIDELKPKVLITSAALVETLDEIAIPDGCHILVVNDRYLTPENYADQKRDFNALNQTVSSVHNWMQLERKIAEVDGMCTYKRKSKPALNEPVLFIFTSGTTGLPKAAIITLARYVLMSLGPHELFRIDRNHDILYDPLPLYHTAGGITGMGQHVIFGVTLALRRKFSASQFWSDCVRYDASIVQYIGETCRYLLAQPKRPEETAHRVRLAYGNGVRQEVWSQFVERFKVKQIGEFYGATESNANFVNSENKFGAIGFSSVIAPFAYPVYLVRTDPVTEELVRDPKTGLCIQCEYGEVGQLIGAIRPHDATRSFDGYVNKAASTRKIVKDVFRKGDSWFLSGDLLVQDDLGFFYFRDRLGDTFRWRGENVSTGEVESVMSKYCPSATSCVVFGVPVPHCEGKAGMATVSLAKAESDGGFVHANTPSTEEALEQMRKGCVHDLPPYAHPLFIRVVDKIDTTGTFKLRKSDLVKHGFKPNTNSNDLLYYLNNKTGSYEVLTQDIYDSITAGTIRF